MNEETNTARNTTITETIMHPHDEFARGLTQYASIKREGSNEDYQAQDLPYATFPSLVGKVYRAGTKVGGRRCPRCPDFIAVTSRVMRLRHPENGRWLVHERCFAVVVIENDR